MVIVGGTFEVDPIRREEFLESHLDTMRRSRAEPGCLDYTFSADPLEPHRVVLFERWATQEDLDAHLAGLRTSEPQTSMSVAPTKATIVIYDVAGQRVLGG